MFFVFYGLQLKRIDTLEKGYQNIIRDCPDFISKCVDLF